MHNPQFIDKLNVDQDVSRRLSQSISNVVAGSSEVFRTPFLRDLEEHELLNKFDRKFEHQLDSLSLDLKKLELSNRGKFGPRSILKPWKDRRDSLKTYFEPDKFTGEVRFDAGYARLRPLSLPMALRLLKNNTSSGLPYLKKKGTVKERMLTRFKEDLARQDPCVLFSKTEDSKKVRDVWGYPGADALLEMTLFKPVMEYRKKYSLWRSSLRGPSSVDKRITSLFARKERGERLVSVDFSKYDASVRETLQKHAWNMVKDLFQSEAQDMLDYVQERFLNIGIITPDGIWKGPHGVPSGSTFTNEIDSNAQYVVANSILDPSSVGDINGDDGVYLTPSPDKLFQAFINAGLNLNVDKTHVSDNYFVYLQNFYSEDYQSDGVITGIYPIYRAYMRLIFQQQWSKFEDYDISGVDYYSIRAIGILENCRYHPLFEQFVQFVVDNDKYGLAVSEKGIAKFVRMIEQSSGSQGILQNQRGDDMKGIRNFATFKLIQEMSM